MEQTERATDFSGAVPLTASLILAGLCFLWGGNTVSIRFSNQGIPPLVAATARSVVACTLLWLYARVRDEAVFFPRKEMRHAVVIGVLFGLEFVFIYWGLAFTHASRGVIFVYTHPFWVALGAHFLIPGDRLNVVKVAGLVLAFGGLVAVFGAQSEALDPRHWIGDLMMLCAGLAWGLTTLYIKKVVQNKEFTHYQTMFAQLFFSIPVLGLAWLAFQWGEPVALTSPVLLAFGYQCVVVAFFSYLLWFWMIHRFSVSRLTAFTFLAPLFGVILSGLILREPIPLLLWVGLVLVGAGIYIVNRPSPGLKSS